jgi:flagellar biosynthesis regulator FlaF
MTAPSRDSYSEGSVIELQTSLGEDGTSLDDYLLNSTVELNAIAELVSRGEVVDRASRDWILAQVDFIVETIGNESPELGDELRSNLLQLLLAIANLNEQIRRQASLAL